MKRPTARSLLVCVASIGAFSALIGCEAFDKSVRDAVSEAQDGIKQSLNPPTLPPSPLGEARQPDDIPIHPGLVLDGLRSYSYEQPPIRVAALFYRGPVGVRNAENYFVEALAQTGWTQEAAIGAPRQRELRFRKGPDFLAIRLTAVREGCMADLDLDYQP